MSWKALDWATDINVGSPTMRLILILLANKADEQFSCYPSVRTLMAESCAARSTVLKALNRLEHEGFITRVAQYHESGAQRCSRYFLNHPDAPHLKAGPDSGPPGPQAGRAGSRPQTRGVHDLDPPGVRRPDALNPPEESPSVPSCLLRSMPEPWRLSGREATKLSPAIKRALGSGWTAQSLMAHLSRSPEGVRYPAAVLARRLAELQRHRARRSDVACLGAASARTISRGPSPSQCPTEPRRRHSAPAAVLKCGHARSTGTYPISAQ